MFIYNQDSTLGVSVKTNGESSYRLTVFPKLVYGVRENSDADIGLISLDRVPLRLPIVFYMLTFWRSSSELYSYIFICKKTFCYKLQVTY